MDNNTVNKVENCKSKIKNEDIDAIEINRKIHCLRELVFDCKERSTKCDKRLNEILISIHKAIHLLNEVKRIVIEDRLAKWKHDQILVVQSLPEVLNEIQNWLEELVIIIFKIRSWLETVRCFANDAKLYEDFENVHRDLNNCLKSLIATSFIVEEQPTQVIKKDTR